MKVLGRYFCGRYFFILLIVWTSPGNKTVKLSRRQMIVLRMERPSLRDETIHDTVSWNSRNFAFIRPLVYSYHVISRIQSYSIGIKGAGPTVSDNSWGTCLFSDSVGASRWRRGMQRLFLFVNIDREQWTLSGFLQHTSANKIYIKLQD